MLSNLYLQKSTGSLNRSNPPNSAKCKHLQMCRVFLWLRNWIKLCNRKYCVKVCGIVLLGHVGSHFHFCSFQWIIILSKCVPVDTISVWTVRSAIIKSVKVRPMTSIIPPSAFVRCCTVLTTLGIVVAVYRGKRHITRNLFFTNYLICNNLNYLILICTSLSKS